MSVQQALYEVACQLRKDHKDRTDKDLPPPPLPRRSSLEWLIWFPFTVIVAAIIAFPFAFPDPFGQQAARVAARQAEVREKAAKKERDTLRESLAALNRDVKALRSDGADTARRAAKLNSRLEAVEASLKTARTGYAELSEALEKIKDDLKKMMDKPSVTTDAVVEGKAAFPLRDDNTIVVTQPKWKLMDRFTISSDTAWYVAGKRQTKAPGLKGFYEVRITLKGGKAVRIDVANGTK